MARWILPLLVGLVIALGGVLYARQQAAVEMVPHREATEQALLAELEAAILEHDALVDSLSARLARIDDLKTAQEQALRRVRNAEHLAAARRLGIGRSPDLETINRLVESGDLVRLKDNAYYWIQDLDYSVPYVVPPMADVLQQIGQRFHAQLQEEGLPPFRFNVSSVLRTSENQRALRRINPNAARGVSAHEFGTTVDVVFHTYDVLPDSAALARETPSVESLFSQVHHRSLHGLAMVYWQELQGILGRILIELQGEGLLHVTLEREQPVFHMTVARAPAAE